MDNCILITKGRELNKSSTSIVSEKSEEHLQDHNMVSQPFNEEVNKTMDAYSEVILEDAVCYGCEELGELRKASQEMVSTITQLKEIILNLDEDLTMKKEKIGMMEENLAYYLDENVKVKNELKYLKGSESMNSTLSLGHEKHDNDHISFHQDFMDFKTLVMEEIATIKGVISSCKDQEKEDDNISEDAIIISSDEDQQIDTGHIPEVSRINFKPKAMIKSKSDSDVNKVLMNQCSAVFNKQSDQDQGVINKQVIDTSKRWLNSGNSSVAKLTPVKRIVPGTKLYSKTHLRTTLIISDSTISRIPAWQLKKNIDVDHEAVITKRHPGSTAEEIFHFLLTL